MGRTPTAQTVALRDQIVATLRDRAAPITTGQVVALARPVGQCTSSRNFGECVYIWRDHHPCQGHCWKTRIYNSLRALERRGIVICHRPPDMYSVLWSAAADPTDAEMNKVLDSLEANDA